MEFLENQSKPLFELDLDPVNRALSNDVILRKVFSYLPLDDLKESRLVCYKWKEVIDVSLKKRARLALYFGYGSYSSSSFSNYPPPAQLKDILNEESPFDSLLLGYRLPWSRASIRDFFVNEGKFIKELSFLETSFGLDEDGTAENSPLVFLLGEVVNLRKLEIVNSFPWPTFKVPLSYLSNIPFISLTSCSVELTKDINFAPIQLNLMNVIYTRNDAPISNILINSFVDFSHMRSLSLSGSQQQSPGCELILDLKGAVSLDELSLRNVKVLSIDKSKWTADKMNLFGFSSPINIKMNVKYFEIDDNNFSLSDLPRSADAVVINQPIKISSVSPLFHMPSTKYLALQAPPTIRSFFEQDLFHRFSNLRDLKLNFPERVMRLSSFPPSLENLEIRVWDDLRFVGDGVKTLNTLTLKCSSISFAGRFFKHFAPSNFFVFLDNPWNDAAARNFFKCVPRNLYLNLVIGIFKSQNPFRSLYFVRSYEDYKTPKLPSIQNADEYYAFVNIRGKAVKFMSYGEAKKEMLLLKSVS